MGNEKIFLHPRLVDTTLVVVVMVAEDVLTTSDFSVVCVLVKANTFLGARSNGDNVKSAPDNGHFSCVTRPFSTSSSVSLSLELPSNEHCSEKLTDDDGVMTVGDVVQLSDRCGGRGLCVGCFAVWKSSPFNSDSTRMARTSGGRDFHMLAMDFGTTGERLSIMFMLCSLLVWCG